MNQKGKKLTLLAIGLYLWTILFIPMTAKRISGSLFIWLAIYVALCIFLYQGRKWARYIIAGLSMLSLIPSVLSLFMLTMSHFVPHISAIFLTFAVSNGTVVYLLLFSPSVKTFLEEQRGSKANFQVAPVKVGRAAIVIFGILIVTYFGVPKILQAISPPEEISKFIGTKVSSFGGQRWEGSQGGVDSDHPEEAYYKAEMSKKEFQKIVEKAGFKKEPNLLKIWPDAFKRDTTFNVDTEDMSFWAVSGKSADNYYKIDSKENARITAAYEDGYCYILYKKIKAKGQNEN